MSNNIFSVSYFLEIFPKVVGKLDVTLYLTLIAMICALILGTILAIIAFYRVPVLYQISRVYIAFMRGPPAAPQLFFFYYGLALISTTITNMSATTAVAIIISLNMGAFMSESIRAALMSVDVGQREAAASLGMNGLQTVIRVILPQAIRVALPPLFNDIINIIKMTSLAFILGILPMVIATGPGSASRQAIGTGVFFGMIAAVTIGILFVPFFFVMIYKTNKKMKIKKTN